MTEYGPNGTGRQGDDERGLGDGDLRIPPTPDDGKGRDPLAGPQARDALADLAHVAGHLDAGREGQLQPGHDAPAEQHLGIVHARVRHVQAHLARARTACLLLDDREDLNFRGAEGTPSRASLSWASGPRPNGRRRRAAAS